MPRIRYDVTGSNPDEALKLRRPPKLPAIGEAASKPGIRYIGVGEEEVDEDLDAIVDGLIFAGQRILVVSLPKVGKSVMAVAASGAILRSDPFLNLVTEPVKILYMTEEGMATFKLKLQQFGIEAGSDFKYLRHRAPGVARAKWPDIVSITLETAQEFGAGLVWVDVGRASGIGELHGQYLMAAADSLSKQPLEDAPPVIPRDNDETGS